MDSEGIVGPSITSGVTVPAGAVIVYQITFDKNGGTGGSNSSSAVYGGTPSSITPPSRTGYTFNGYYTKKNGGGDKYFNADGSYAKGTWKETQDVTLYAQWIITLDASNINSATDLRNELAKYSGREIIVELNGKNLSVNNSDFTLYREFFEVKDGSKVTITGGAIKVEGDFSSFSSFNKFFLFSVNGVDSSLTLSDCTLLGVDSKSAGMTAVKVSSGSVNLINTTISNIVSNDNGAGVYVESNGSVTMNGGAISNNVARYGAAVYLLDGTFTMENGDISNNRCVNGSVISGSSGRFVWNGGTISGNTNGSADGGGVFGKDVEYGGTMNKDDAS
ncbi:MAG: InlB B-repeat-containing protein [Spirochaetaceae bacterium]|nr:InlB B-repeat-containing protein [Spirochaetaceae bacterium]